MVIHSSKSHRHPGHRQRTTMLPPPPPRQPQNAPLQLRSLLQTLRCSPASRRLKRPRCHHTLRPSQLKPPPPLPCIITPHLQTRKAALAAEDYLSPGTNSLPRPSKGPSLPQAWTAVWLLNKGRCRRSKTIHSRCCMASLVLGRCLGRRHSLRRVLLSNLLPSRLPLYISCRCSVAMVW